MKYIQTIFEDQDVQALAIANEPLIQYSADLLVESNVNLINYVVENMDQFLVEGDLASTYENIRNFAVQANLNTINENAIILADPRLSEEEKAYYINEVINTIFKGVGDGVHAIVTAPKRAVQAITAIPGQIASVVRTRHDNRNRQHRQTVDALNSSTTRNTKLGQELSDLQTRHDLTSDALIGTQSELRNLRAKHDSTLDTHQTLQSQHDANVADHQVTKSKVSDLENQRSNLTKSNKNLKLGVGLGAAGTLVGAGTAGYYANRDDGMSAKQMAALGAAGLGASAAGYYATRRFKNS